MAADRIRLDAPNLSRFVVQRLGFTIQCIFIHVLGPQQVFWPVKYFGPLQKVKE